MDFCDSVSVYFDVKISIETYLEALAPCVHVVLLVEVDYLAFDPSFICHYLLI